MCVYNNDTVFNTAINTAFQLSRLHGSVKQALSTFFQNFDNFMLPTTLIITTCCCWSKCSLFPQLEKHTARVYSVFQVFFLGGRGMQCEICLLDIAKGGTRCEKTKIDMSVFPFCKYRARKSIHCVWFMIKIKSFSTYFQLLFHTVSQLLSSNKLACIYLNHSSPMPCMFMPAAASK